MICLECNQGDDLVLKPPHFSSVVFILLKFQVVSNLLKNIFKKVVLFHIRVILFATPTRLSYLE